MSAPSESDWERLDESVHAYLRDKWRLEPLTNEQLFKEVLRTPLGDNPLVLELMDRLEPNWTDWPDFT